MSSVDLICMSQCVADRTDVKFYGGCKPGDGECRLSAESSLNWKEMVNLI